MDLDIKIDVHSNQNYLKWKFYTHIHPHEAESNANSESPCAKQDCVITSELTEIPICSMLYDKISDIPSDWQLDGAHTAHCNTCPPEGSKPERLSYSRR